MAERRTLPTPSKTYNSLVASAAVLTGPRAGSARLGRSQDWQTELWDYYDQIGEYRAGIGWLANAMSRVNLVAATAPANQGEEPGIIKLPEDEGTQTPALDGTDGTDATPVSDIDAACAMLVAAIAGGVDGQGQLLWASAIQLEVPGVGYIMMEPDLPPPPPPGPQVVTLDTPPVPLSVIRPTPDETWKWRVLSQDEIKQEGEIYHVQEEDGKWRPLPPEAIVIKVWNAHPRKSWMADSPSRACLTVLRQINMLDQHVEASATSRLAGAGLLIFPSEATFPTPPRPANTPAPLTPPNDLDDLMDVLVQTMELGKRDRSSPAASVPLAVKIPGEYVDKVRHITFWSEFSEHVLPLRESNVKRLALTLDMPPEALLGIGDVNHWGAWAITEEGITLHIEPMSERICHGLTVGYLRPALLAMSFPPEEVAQKLVWYQTVDLAARPDRSGVSLELYNVYELSGDALRRESGLNEEDRPNDAEKQLRILLDIAKADPKAGPAILAAAGILDAKIAEVAPAPVPTEPGPAPGSPAPPDTQPVQGPPQTKDNPPPPPTDGPPSSSALIEAADGLVYRALERSGARLRSAAGRTNKGGAAAISCPDPTRLHVEVKAGDFAKLDELLAGAWERVPQIAARLGVDAETFTQTLDTYCRALLATGHAHDSDRLAEALGLYAAV